MKVSNYLLALSVISDKLKTIIGEISGKDTVTDLPNSIHEKISKATELLRQFIESLEEISYPDLTSEPESNSQSADEYSDTFPQIGRLQFILCQLENVLFIRRDVDITLSPKLSH